MRALLPDAGRVRPVLQLAAELPKRRPVQARLRRADPAEGARMSRGPCGGCPYMDSVGSQKEKVKALQKKVSTLESRVGCLAHQIRDLQRQRGADE